MTAKKKQPEVGGIAVDRLKSLINRIETLREEKAQIVEAISSVFVEAKDAGFNVKAMRHIIKLHAMDSDGRDTFTNDVELYAQALNIWETTPLGSAAKKAGNGTTKPEQPSP